ACTTWRPPRATGARSRLASRNARGFRRARAVGADHLAEDEAGLLHLFDRADRDARMGLLQRRELAADQDAALRAGFLELGGRAARLHEDEVGLRIHHA